MSSLLSEQDKSLIVAIPNSVEISNYHRTSYFIFELPAQELEVANRRLSRSAQETATAEKENRALKQTLKYLQAELVKAGKKVQQQ